jgi:hypothetical protein
MFLLALTNFILITYNYLIEDSEIFNEFVSDLWVFTIIILITYVPISFLIGRWHTNTQLNVDMEMVMGGNPFFAKMIRTLLDVQTGVASEEEINEFRKLISKFETEDTDDF